MYKGTKLCETLKPGETIHGRDHRFGTMGATIGSYKREDVFKDPYKTDSKWKVTYDRLPALQSCKIAHEQRERNKNQVLKFGEGREAVEVAKAKTIYRDSFLDTRNYINELRKTIDEFKEAFFAFPQEEEPEKSGLNCNYIRNLIYRVMGPETPAYVVAKFIKLAREKSLRRIISWEEFCGIIPIALEATYAEADPRGTLSRSGVNIYRKGAGEGDDELLGAYEETSSNYMDFFCSPIEPLPYVHDFPELRAVIKRNPATRELYAGTTKGTAQVPGYEGHIPRNTRNHRKLEHSDGRCVHPVQNSLLLTERGQGCGCMLGYTGYVPQATARAVQKERTTGCDSKTTNGAAYGATRLML
jgi:hypothetical protein